jgi:putative tryptophan/tyrosine transport system substrate-binding protein
MYDMVFLLAALAQEVQMPATIRRRELIVALSSAGVWPLAALAQQSERMRRLGVLMSPREDDSEAQTRTNMLRNGLGELGWTEGRNIHIDYRWAGGDAARARAYAAELVRLTPDVIVANSTLCLKAVREETKTIPTVFLLVGDPVGQGFVSSLARPGGNITGFTAFEFEIGGKWLEIIKEVAPDITRIVFLFNPEAGLPYADKFVQSIAAAAPARGVELVVNPIRNAGEIERTIIGVASGMKSGVIVNPDAFTIAKRGLIISLMAQYRVPAIYAYKYYAVDGGLLSYGHTYDELFPRAAAYIDRILKGAKPGDLPVQNPTKFELIINQKTAKALGLTIPDKLLARADEVIE